LLDADQTQDYTNETTRDPNGTIEDSLPEKWKPPLMYLFFQFHNLICVISLALLTVSQALPPPHVRPLIITALIHFYVFIASIVGIIVELDVSQWFMTNIVPLLQNWVVRGAFYIFIGLFGAEESTFYHPDSKDDNNDDNTGVFVKLGAHLSSLLLWTSAIGLIISGFTYVLLGGLCLKSLKQRSEEAKEERLRKMMRDIEDV